MPRVRGLRRFALCAKLALVPMQNPDFSEIVAQICKEDSRYDRRAYDFVRLGLEHTVKDLRKKDSARAERSRHVSGPELLDGLRAYALEQFGPLAKTVLNTWGIESCRDIGNVVFNLIEYNVFSKTDNDRREDFSDVYDFDEAFVKPFQPTKQRSRGPTSAEAFGAA
jgi:uncharacterized repeat protein (TIGR04138 family)